MHPCGRGGTVPRAEIPRAEHPAPTAKPDIQIPHQAKPDVPAVYPQRTSGLLQRFPPGLEGEEDEGQRGAARSILAAPGQRVRAGHALQHGIKAALQTAQSRAAVAAPSV